MLYDITDTTERISLIMRQSAEYDNAERFTAITAELCDYAVWFMADLQKYAAALDNVRTINYDKTIRNYNSDIINSLGLFKRIRHLTVDEAKDYIHDLSLKLVTLGDEHSCPLEEIVNIKAFSDKDIQEFKDAYLGSAKKEYDDADEYDADYKESMKNIIDNLTDVDCLLLLLFDELFAYSYIEESETYMTICESIYKYDLDQQKYIKFLQYAAGSEEYDDGSDS